MKMDGRLERRVEQILWAARRELVDEEVFSTQEVTHQSIDGPPNGEFFRK